MESKNNSFFFARISSRAKKFITSRTKKFGSVRKYVLHLLKLDGYEYDTNDF